MTKELDTDLIYCYSKLYCNFIKTLESKVKKILSSEMGIVVNRTRFTFNGYSYPIKVALFEHPKKLGYFCTTSFVIGIHKEFTLSKNEAELENLLRHELAHFYVYLSKPAIKQAHGKDFRDVCKQFGWTREVYLSTHKKSDLLKEAISKKNKIHKLIALGNSTNAHEAKGALKKAKQLIEKYEINQPDRENEIEMVAKKIHKQKKSSTLLTSICSILEEFFVIPIISHSKRGVYLEIFGKNEHVEIAEYIAKVLLKKLPSLFETTNFKGIVMRNSFYMGFTKGFKENLTPKKKQCYAIVKTNNDLNEMLTLAYPQLKTSRAKISFNKQASNSGYKAGKTTVMKKGMKDFSKKPLNLLG